MPLLKKQEFIKAELPLDLKENEKVFYCPMTHEIFRNYEEFCQRIILCNSMVWTCTYTGKAGLTYTEAVDSEENAQQLLKGFPAELKIPLLFLASKTHRATFSEMADDIFQFMKDRYFVGENVEASFTGNKWRESHILQVIGPSEEIIKNSRKNGHIYPPSNLYRYEVEQLDAEDEDVSEVMIVDFAHIRRKKLTFSREKSKLFLKQYVKQDKNGVFIIKDTVLEDFSINKVKFDQIFDGPLPNFITSKKLLHNVNGKKTKQDTLSQFLTKHNGVNNSKENSINLMEQMKKRQEEFQLIKQKRLEEKLAEKLKRKEDNIKIGIYIKEWYKPKEDLMLEDQKVLPVPAPLVTKIPDEHVGNVLEILEFVHSFSKILHSKDFFPDGLTLELMERSLMQKEIAGPLVDLIQMFLVALFKLQAEETAQHRSGDVFTDLKEIDIKDNLNFNEASLYATVASNWSAAHQGMPLNKLPLYSLTTTEVLRLHLLSSGARINEAGAKWRYQHRGGYTSEDDPGLYLCLKQPHIIKSLALHSVSEFSVKDKLEVISCLMNQLLTYADVRDIVEDRLDKSKHAKFELKALQAADKKREQEFLVSKHRLNKEYQENNKDPASALQKMDNENESNKLYNERQMAKLMKQSVEHQIILGLDRAFRKYIKLQSIPGLFVNFEETNSGQCLSKTVKQNSSLVGADRNDVLAHLRQTFDSINLPENADVKLNGNANSPDTDAPSISPEKLMICNADPKTCVVHSNTKKQLWSFYHQEDDIEELINSLNKRGLRESELRVAIENEQKHLLSLINNTPVTQLNSNIEVEEAERKPRTKRKNKYEDPNLGYSLEMSPSTVLQLVLIDNILEIEEKLHAGHLGNLKIKDRDAWREHLTKQEFDKLDKTIIIRDSNLKKDVKSSTPDLVDANMDTDELLEVKSIAESEDSDIECEDLPLRQPKNIKFAIKSLAIALVQVAQSVEKRYLRKPLGRVGVRSTTKKKEFDILPKWETSLMAVTSYSQIFLYFSTLDKCIAWHQSTLLAKCRICGRQTDSENMLLCDCCNKGQHLYCIRPKLASVPEGNWYCKKCTQKKLKEEKKNKKESESKPVVTKKRKIFVEELSDDENTDDVSNEAKNSDNEVEEEKSEDEDTEEEEADLPEVENKTEVASEDEVCSRCNTGGTLLLCDVCPNMYHVECAEPPLRRIPRGAWICHDCKNKRTRESSDSDEESKSKRRSNRREGESRDDLPLHNAPLQELLSDILKQDQAWPFLRPVQKNEVPDYYQIITKPMDFGTIKYKLNMGEYHCDAQVMADAALIFENCNTYNNTDDEVYQCGVDLQKYFINKCKELGLKLPRGIENHTDKTFKHKDKKMRTT